MATLRGLEGAGIRPLALLRELTELMPADAWLQTISMDRQGVEMTGQATAASPLVPLLEGSPRLDRVEFTSPVTKTLEKERFRLRASWEASR
jgi:Tfp pilus assembly protein PilN